MDQAKHAVHILADERDCVQCEWDRQARQQALDHGAGLSQITGFQISCKSQVKPKFLADIRIAPSHQQTVLALGQPAGTTTIQFGFSRWVPKPVKLRHATKSHTIEVARIPLRRKRKERPDRLKRKTIEHNGGGARCELGKSPTEFVRRLTCSKSERRLKSPVKPIFPRLIGETVDVRECGLPAQRACADVPSEPRRAESRKAGVFRQVVNRISLKA